VGAFDVADSFDVAVDFWQPKDNATIPNKIKTALNFRAIIGALLTAREKCTAQMESRPLSPESRSSRREPALTDSLGACSKKMEPAHAGCYGIS
jgi:hypothetical protein